MRLIKMIVLVLVLGIFIIVSPDAFGQRRRVVRKTPKKTTVFTRTNTTVSTANTNSVSDTEISGGLKEALAKGIKTAVDSLGRENGFLDNLRVKIPIPAKLQTLEKGLRFAGQGRAVDEFIGSMNHAAEKAVPVAFDVFVDSIRQMSFTDAKNILFSGQDDAATQFFRRTTEETLRGRFRPIVEKFTAEAGVTSNYKKMIGKAGFATQLLGQDATDIDGYVTQKALDGLFLLVADEEKSIRQDPIGRTTSLLKKVFGILR